MQVIMDEIHTPDLAILSEAPVFFPTLPNPVSSGSAFTSPVVLDLHSRQHSHIILLDLMVMIIHARNIQGKCGLNAGFILGRHLRGWSQLRYGERRAYGSMRLIQGANYNVIKKSCYNSNTSVSPISSLNLPSPRTGLSRNTSYGSSSPSSD